MVRDIKSSGFWVVLPVLDPAFLFSPFSCHLEFLVSLLKDRFFPSFELVFRGDISDGAVKANGVVVFDKPADEALGILKRKRRARPQAPAFEGFMPPLYLAVTLGIIR